MDFRTIVDNQSFGVRVSALIIEEDKIYLAKSRNGEYYLLGGAIQVGEDTETAMKRELMEEIGLRVTVDSLAFVVENQFVREGRYHHQIEFLYLVTPFEKPTEQRFEEESHHRTCEWIKLADLPLLDNLNPDFLKEDLVKWDGKLKHVIERKRRKNGF